MKNGSAPPSGRPPSSLQATDACHGYVALPHTGSRQAGVQAYYWTLRDFCAERLLRFLFAEAQRDEYDFLTAAKWRKKR